MSNAIIFDHVSKRYFLNRQRSDNFREALTSLFRCNHREEFWALKDLSFEVEEGEALGIIGLNGAGKSTTLKILSKIIKPTRGGVEIKGKVAALIEVGAGFHPDLTGRENVYLNGSIVGLTRQEIDKKFDSIVEFAEIGQFIDVPVKRYSSGMQMRLGFAVAAHLDPDILLVDEVLAVGDLVFQRKCLSAIQGLRRAGKTILFVSHSMEAVASLCTRVLFLLHGELMAAGTPDAVISEYRQRVFQGNLATASPAKPSGSKLVEIASVTIEDEAGAERRIFSTGETIVIRGSFRCRERIVEPVFHAAIHRVDGLYCFGTNTVVESIALAPIKGEGCFSIALREVNLMPGSYLVSVRVSGPDIYTYFDNHDMAYGLVIDKSKVGWGAFYIPHTWKVETDGTARRLSVERESSDGKPSR